MREPTVQENAVSKQLIGAAIEVHRHRGPGYLESVYEKALCMELAQRGIPHECQVPVDVFYKGNVVGEGRVDLLVAGCIIVELKAIEKLLPVHQAQIISYLKARKLVLGILLNFNVAVLRDGIQRVVYSG